MALGVAVIVALYDQNIDDINAQRNITFSAPDGVQLQGTFYRNSDKIIVLIHQYGGDRHQWDSFVPILVANNYSVLAYDIRGFGQSGGAPEKDKMIRDVAGAVMWIKNNTSPSFIGLIGASVGANIAFESSSFGEINTSTALSPANKLLGNELSNFRPHNVLFLSDINEREAAQSLHAITIPPKDIKIYGGTAHGVELLNNPQTILDILAWLDKDK